MHARFSWWPRGWTAAAMVIATAVPAGGAAAATHAGIGSPRPATLEPAGIDRFAIPG